MILFASWVLGYSPHFPDTISASFLYDLLFGKTTFRAFHNFPSTLDVTVPAYNSGTIVAIQKCILK